MPCRLLRILIVKGLHCWGIKIGTSSQYDKILRGETLSNYLTKSKYLNGLQCHKRLWYEENHPERKPEITISQRRIFDQSNKVGILARDHFPEGTLINAAAPRNSVKQTEMAIRRDDSCIFEASFIFNDVWVRCDILEKDSKSWRLTEVKASTSVKEEHLQDLAIQKYVLTELGLSISETQLMFINNKDCVYPDLSNLFTIENVTDQVNLLMDNVPNNIETFKTILGKDVEPNVLIGEQCDKPNLCPFKAHCWQSVPIKSIFTIPRLSWKKKNLLIEEGILSIFDLPTDFSLTPPQRTYVNSILHNRPSIDKIAIRQELANLQYPIHFLDFESDNPAIPRFDGLRPYQQFPFQYSCHILQSNGTITHHEYLHTDMSDPREPLLESLLNHISTNGSIVVYNASFEKGILEGLALSFPEHVSSLQLMIDRFWDQLDIFKNHYVHPDFCGSNSLKTVLSVLVPSLDYQDLDVRDGTEAQATWNLMLNTEDEIKKNEWINRLKAYCMTDTLATVEIYKVLRTL